MLTTGKLRRRAEGAHPTFLFCLCQNAPERTCGHLVSGHPEGKVCHTTPGRHMRSISPGVGSTVPFGGPGLRAASKHTSGLETLPTVACRPQVVFKLTAEAHLGSPHSGWHWACKRESGTVRACSYLVSFCQSFFAGLSFLTSGGIEFDQLEKTI